MTQVEQDGVTTILYPQEARVRNLTYAMPLYVEIHSKLLLAGDVDDPIEADWAPALNEDGMPIEEHDQALIGRVSVLLLRNANGSVGLSPDFDASYWSCTDV